MPTRRGVVVACAGAVLLAAGSAFGYRELVLLGASALLAVVAAVLLVGRPVRPQVRRRIPVDRVAAGDTVTVTVDVTLDGGTRRPVMARERTDGPDGRVYHRLPLVRGASGSTTYEVAASRRGVIDIGPLEAGRVDPLGLAATIRPYGEVNRVWVHPPVLPLLGMPPGLIPDPDGHHDSARAGGLTFHGLREHVPGDDLRQVHWRSSARQGRLMVREYVDTSRPRLVVLVDERAPDRDTLDEVACAAASVLAASVRSGLGCELRLTGGRRVEGGAGAGGMLDALAELAPAVEPGSVRPRRSPPPTGRSSSTPVSAPAVEPGGVRPRRSPPLTGRSGSNPVSGADGEPGADVAAEPTPGPGIAEACRTLRLRPAGDAVVLVTGTASEDELVAFGALRDRYASLVAVAIGGSGAALPDLPVLRAATAADLPALWNGAPR